MALREKRGPGCWADWIYGVAEWICRKSNWIYRVFDSLWRETVQRYNCAKRPARRRGCFRPEFVFCAAFKTTNMQTTPSPGSLRIDGGRFNFKFDGEKLWQNVHKALIAACNGDVSTAFVAFLLSIYNLYFSSIRNMPKGVIRLYGTAIRLYYVLMSPGFHLSI